MLKIEQLTRYKENRVEVIKPRPVCVMKFGGTSVGSAEMIGKTADIIVSYFEKGVGVIPVVSAMRGVTDQLISIARLQDIQEAEEKANEIFLSHGAVARRLFKNGRPVMGKMRELRAELINDIHDNSMDSEERVDRILSYGERLSARLVSAAIRQRLKNGTSIYLDTTGVIVTNREFGNAQPNDEKSKKNADRIPQFLAARIIPVVTGFIGATDDGRFTTLGRNGSDFSAAYLGKLMNANEIIIWTDVDGIFDKDPNKFPDAKIIPYLSYGEADIMAKAGAKLHSRTLEPLFGSNINLRVKNTFNPDAPGTLITCANEREEVQ